MSEPFIFPFNRFPTFDAPSGFPAEEFGPPLQFQVDQSVDERGRRIGSWYRPEYIQTTCVLRPGQREVAIKRMEILYSVYGNNFIRPILDQADEKSTKSGSGWESFTWRFFNMSRIVESDHKMAYLSKQHIDNNHDGGFIEWRFDLKSEGFKVKDLKVRLPFTNFRDGQVKVTVCSLDDYVVLSDPNRLKSVPRAVGWDEFTIRAELMGKELHYCYQNAQLFRQSISEDPLIPNVGGFGRENVVKPFHVIIEMERA